MILDFTVGSTDLQKIKKTVDNLYAEKQKLEKEKSKKGSKGKTKVNLRIETDSVSITYKSTHKLLYFLCTQSALLI